MNDKTKKVIDICSLFLVSQVSTLMSEMVKNPDVKILSSPNWKRIVNFAVSNDICDFDRNLNPRNLRPVSKLLTVAKLIQDSFEDRVTSIDKNYVVEIIDKNYNQPFELVDDQIYIKKDWQFVFDEHSEHGIFHWLKNFFHVSIKFYTPKNLKHAIINGGPTWQQVFGENVRELFDLKKFDSELFLSVMRAMHQSNSKESETLIEILKEYACKEVLDVGGATGAFSRAFSKANPSSEVSVYEKNDTLTLVKSIASELSLQEPENFKYIPGDFFHRSSWGGLIGIPSEARYDLIILGWILHDWSDEECIEILGKVVFHLKKNGVVLLLEKPLSPEGLGPSTTLDLTMLFQTGGKERTLSEYIKIGNACGLKFKLHHPTNSRRDLIFLENHEKS